MLAVKTTNQNPTSADLGKSVFDFGFFPRLSGVGELQLSLVSFEKSSLNIINLQSIIFKVYRERNPVWCKVVCSQIRLLSFSQVAFLPTLKVDTCRSQDSVEKRISYTHKSTTFILRCRVKNNVCFPLIGLLMHKEEFLFPHTSDSRITRLSLMPLAFLGKPNAVIS